MSDPTRYPSGFFAASGRKDFRPPPPPPPPPGAMQEEQPYMYSYSQNNNNNNNNNTRQQQPRQNFHTHPTVHHGSTSFHNSTARGYSFPPAPPRPQYTKRTVAAAAAAPPPPVKQEFKCNACDLILDSATALESHCKSHIQCTKCSFTAAPKVVKGHFSAVHGKFSGSGFKTVTVAVPGCKVRRFQICVGNRPEDIQRWIAERRKRFPRVQTQQAKQRAPSKVDTEQQQAKGLSSLLAGYGSSSSEEDEEGVIDSKVEEATKSSESKKEAVPLHPTTTQEADPANNTAQSTSQPNYRTRPCRFFMRNGNCRNGDSCNFSHEAHVVVRARREGDQSSRSNNSKKRKINEATPKTTRQKKSKPSLLQKLLANDSKREAALTLQLLEYIVDSNFLQHEQSGKV